MTLVVNTLLLPPLLGMVGPVRSLDRCLGNHDV